MHACNGRLLCNLKSGSWVVFKTSFQSWVCRYLKHHYPVHSLHQHGEGRKPFLNHHLISDDVRLAVVVWAIPAPIQYITHMEHLHKYSHKLKVRASNHTNRSTAHRSLLLKQLTWTKESCSMWVGEFTRIPRSWCDMTHAQKSAEHL